LRGVRGGNLRVSVSIVLGSTAERFREARREDRMDEQKLSDDEIYSTPGGAMGDVADADQDDADTADTDDTDADSDDTDADSDDAD
jgi:hypothetical protein